MSEALPLKGAKRGEGQAESHAGGLDSGQRRAGKIYSGKSGDDPCGAPAVGLGDKGMVG